MLALICLLLLFLVAIRTPTFQNWAVTEVATYLSRITKHEVKIGYIRIGWLDELLLEDVVILDRQRNEMINVGSLKADFDLFTLLTTAEPMVTEVWLDQPNVTTVVMKDSERLNINELIDAFADVFAGKDTTSNLGHSIFHINQIHIKDGVYSYFDQVEDSIPNQFDYFHFTLDSINGEIDRFRVAGDTFEINVQKLSCFDRKTKLKVHELNVFYRLSAYAMEFEHLDAHIGKSHVKDYLEFRYDSIGAMINFNEQVTLKAHLDSSILHTEDIAHFAPALNTLKDVYTIWTDMDGQVVDLSFRNLILNYGQNSRVKGRIEFKGFPNLDETFVDARFKELSTHSTDLKQYVGTKTKQVLDRFGKINYEGNFIGFFTDFVSKGKFETGLGDLVSDINIKIKEDEKNSEYHGKLSTSHFLLGKLMDQEDLLGSIDMSGTIKGYGFTYDNARFDLNATIRRVGVHQYNYQNLKVEANLAKGAFKGKIISADTNAKFTLNGLLDFSRTPYFMDFEADFKHIDLKQLNILDEPISFNTKASLRIHGESLDDFEGDAAFSNSYLTNSKKTISLDTIKLITEKIDGERYVNIFSDLFEINADGNFSYETLAKDLPRLYREYLMVIDNSKKTVSDYYNNAVPYGNADYKINFSFLLKKTNPIISLFTQDFTLSDNTRLNGTFGKLANKVSFNLVGSCDEMKFGDVKLLKSRLSYSSSKSLNHPFVDGAGVFISQKQYFGNELKTEGLNTKFTWNNDEILFDASVAQKRNDNHLIVDGRLKMEEGAKDFFFHKVDLKLLKTRWVGDSSQIVFGKDKIAVKHFGLRNENQKLFAEGFISNDTEDDLHLELQNFQVRPLGAALDKDLDGVINGDFVFSNLLTKNFKLDFDGGIVGLKLDKFLIGDIFGQMDWSSEKEQFDVDFVLKRDSIPNLDIKGNIKPFENNRLALIATLDRFNLQVFEPFIKDNFSGIWGACTGKLNIGGTLFRPNLTGDVHVEKGKFKFNFLNTSYTFNDNVRFDTSSIHVSNVALADTFGNRCTVNGKISHNRFRDIAFDFNAKFKDLLVLNTEEKNNPLFYGKTFATGTFKISGPLEDLNVYVNAKNEKYSELFIPVSSAESLGGNEFITFVQKKEIKKKEEEEDEIIKEEDEKPSRTNIKLDLDINPEMEFSLILDKQTGDIITGRGSGNLKLNASTMGDFGLFGTYTFKDGFYNFTLLNLVNRRFTINNGSTIAWNGDPLGGILDIQAEIIEKASLKDILPETDTAWFRNQSIKKTYPVSVKLFLKENLMHPEISYKIQVKDYPLTVNGPAGTYPLDTYVRAFMQLLANDEQQLSRQVFSLLVFHKFFPINNSSGGLAGQGAAGTVSALLSSQLSTLISQVDDDLTVDIDLNGFNAQALNDLRVRLSYQPELFNKRIRITRDGSFTNAQNKSTASSIAGDWSFEYLITPDGTFRLKVFTKNNYNSIATSLNNGNQMSTGFSFMHTQSFDNLAELIRRKKKAEAIVEEEDLEPKEEQNPKTPENSSDTTKPTILLNKRKEDDSN